jgi:lipoprotein-anchoring transpeptidase ErfK/SrfK
MLHRTRLTPAAVLLAGAVLALTPTWLAGQNPALEGGKAGAEAGALKAEPANPQVYRAAMSHRGLRILVSTNERRLLLMAGADTLMDVPVAVGKRSGFEYEGRKFYFETPTGRRSVRGKEENPHWTPPDWHYLGKALELELEVVQLEMESKVELADGSFIMVMDGVVGRLNQFGNFWAFTPGTEIIFDGRLFIPPFGTPQRSIPDALGPYKLDLGDGYLIHGTHLYNEDSIGEPVSHGCVRMDNHDLDRLYFMVERGTPVFIY